MSGPPVSAAACRVLLEVKSDNKDDWKEEFKQFLLKIKDSDGYFRYRWGPWSEDGSKLEMITSFVPAEKLRAFATSPHHQEAIEIIKPVLGHMPTKCPRLDIGGSDRVPAPAIINSPVCEVITIENFTGDLDATLAALKTLEAQDGCLGAHGALACETPDKGVVWNAFVGWKTLEHSQKADKTGCLPAGVGNVDIHHINFNFPIKGYSVTNPGR